jgi:hypothetical protein
VVTEMGIEMRIGFLTFLSLAHCVPFRKGSSVPCFSTDEVDKLNGPKYNIP